ncbi:MAG: 1-phosphofructokinase family hexose kinase [Solirubrobacterales bacterium]|nr:1-phosphofructokinase family hexose kinase [Solirubrobacterales bacterium]
MRQTHTMIITVTLNSAVDKTLEVPGLEVGRRHRSVDAATLPGGKGVNVARVLKALGQPVIATGFAGGHAGARIIEALTEESVLNDFVRISDESRTNTAVLDPTTGEVTEINETGPVVSEREVEIFMEKLRYLARGATMCVLAGSLPLGVPTDIYAQMVRELKRIGVESVVDTEGDPLRFAVKAEPSVVTPNLVEAEGIVGYEFTEDQDAALAVCEIVAHGPAEAVVTTPDGCVARLLDDGVPRLIRATVPDQDVRSATGSGDAFLAGLVAARYSGASPLDSIRKAVACGAESTHHFGAGIVDPAEVGRMIEQVEVRDLAVPANV